MKSPGTRTSAVCGALLALSLVCAANAQETVSPPVPSGLAGRWHLNRELSTLPPSPSTDEPGEQGGGSGAPAGRYVGRRGVGRGGYGGRGGAMGDRGGAQVSPEDVLKMRALMRTFAEPAETLVVLVSAAEVTTTDERGLVLRFRTDGKKEPIDFGPGARIDTRSKWDGDALTQELSAGSMKLTETYRATEQDRMMVVSIQPAAGQSQADRRVPMTPIKFVYERVQ